MSRITATEGVYYDSLARKHLIAVVLDAEEARNIAHAFGPGDKAYDDFLALADEAERLDAEQSEGIGLVVIVEEVSR